MLTWNVDWLFFDIGSTLIDESEAYRHRFQDMAELAGCPYEEIHQGAIAFYKRNQKGDLEMAKKYGLEKPKWHREDERLYEGVPALLEKLSKNYKIGIIANQSLGTEARLREKNILQYIDLVVASAEEGVAKPDLAIFEIALQRSRCQAEHAVMIGDRIDNDIVPAKKMGMHTMWIRQGFGKYWEIQREEEMPEEQVECILDIRDLLAG